MLTLIIIACFNTVPISYSSNSIHFNDLVTPIRCNIAVISDTQIDLCDILLKITIDIQNLKLKKKESLPIVSCTNLDLHCYANRHDNEQSL